MHSPQLVLWLAMAVAAASAGTGKAGEPDEPDYREFWVDTMYMHGPAMPSHAAAPRSSWMVPRQQQRLFAATGTKALDELLQDDECQAVVRVLYDPGISPHSVLATVRFTPTGLHVRTVRFVYGHLGKAEREFTREEGWEKMAVVEERRFSRETRNYLALALNRMRAGGLASAAPDYTGPGFRRDRRRIPLEYPRPRERHGTTERSVLWRVEIRSKGVEKPFWKIKPFSNSFWVWSPNYLADVRYRNTIVCVGRVCEPLAHAARSSWMNERCLAAEVEHGVDWPEKMPGAVEAEKVAGPAPAPAAQPEAVGVGTPERSLGKGKTVGAGWPIFTVGVCIGAILGATGAWVLLRKRLNG